METADHKLTRSWGSSTSAKKFRNAQNYHIKKGNWHLAIQMDVKDITEKFPGKYNQGLREMLDHHVAAKRITPEQRDAIKAKCGL